MSEHAKTGGGTPPPPEKQAGQNPSPRCEIEHALRCAEKIIEELDGRRGIEIRSYDSDTQADIRDAIAEIVCDCLSVSNRSLTHNAGAYADLIWLICEGYHDFEWEYDSDLETLFLRSSGRSVWLSQREIGPDGTAGTLAKLRQQIESEKRAKPENA